MTCCIDIFVFLLYGQGGYNLNSISLSMAMCTRILLGDPCPAIDSGLPSHNAVKSILETLHVHRKYCKSLKYQGDFFNFLDFILSFYGASVMIFFQFFSHLGKDLKNFDWIDPLHMMSHSQEGGRPLNNSCSLCIKMGSKESYWFLTQNSMRLWTSRPMRNFGCQLSFVHVCIWFGHPKWHPG